MKSLSNAFEAHLSGELTTVAHLVCMTRRDGVVLGLTDHDHDLVVDQVTYHAHASFTEEAFKTKGDLKASTMQAVGLLNSAWITEEDLKIGLYDQARIDVYLCNWDDLSQGVMVLQRGWLGDIVLKNGSYQANYIGLCDCLQRRIGDVYTPECRFNLGDAHCAIDLPSLTVQGQVSAVLSDLSFTDYARSEASCYFNYGTLTWLSGAMRGLSFDVQGWDQASQTLTLWLPGAQYADVGDTYQLTPGCDRRFSTCQNRFGNVVRFGGFPHLAGLAKILQYPESS